MQKFSEQICCRQTRQGCKGLLLLNGVGDVKTVSKHGIYKIALPLYNGKIAVWYYLRSGDCEISYLYMH